MGKGDSSNPSLPIFFDQCEAHASMESKIDRVESQQGELFKSVLQSQRDTSTKFANVERKMDSQHGQTTGEIARLREAVTAAMMARAHSNGIEHGRAELSGEIEVKVKTWGKVLKWILGAVAAMALGGGATEGIRRLMGG